MSGTGVSHVTSHIHELLVLLKEAVALLGARQVRAALRTHVLLLAGPGQLFPGENGLISGAGTASVMK